MKYISGNPAHLELTRRNLETLLAKLDDALSVKTLSKQEEFSVGNNVIYVVAVENEKHYADRDPGPVYMPSTGECGLGPVL